MTKRQIIHWCQGQYAAAYFKGRRETLPPPDDYIKSYCERVDTCLRGGPNLWDLYRVRLLYYGREKIHPNRLGVRKTSDDRVTFYFDLDPADAPGLYVCQLIDHVGKSIVVRYLEKALIEAIIQSGKIERIEINVNQHFLSSKGNK